MLGELQAEPRKRTTSPRLKKGPLRGTREAARVNVKILCGAATFLSALEPQSPLLGKSERSLPNQTHPMGSKSGNTFHSRIKAKRKEVNTLSFWSGLGS